MVFPIDPELKDYIKRKQTLQLTPQVIELVSVMDGAHSRAELMNLLGLKDIKYFRREYLQQALKKKCFYSGMQVGAQNFVSCIFSGI